MPSLLILAILNTPSTVSLGSILVNIPEPKTDKKSNKNRDCVK